jgi:hypothetical protein
VSHTIARASSVFLARGDIDDTQFQLLLEGLK